MIKTILIASFIAITVAILASLIGFVSAIPETNDSFSIPEFQNNVVLVTSSTTTTGPPPNPGGDNGNSDPPANPGPPENPGRP